MIFLSSFQLLGPIQKLVSKFSIQKLKTKVENPKVGHDFSFKFSTWKPVFGRAPKVENLTEKSCPTFGFSTLVFHFQVESLETNFWDGPKSWKLERKIKSYPWVFNFGFQFLSWRFENLQWNSLRFKLKPFPPSLDASNVSINAASSSVYNMFYIPEKQDK